MRRRAARVDANQAEIVRGLRDVGASVQSIAPMGDGVPDILVGFRGDNWLMEIKTETGNLTPDELEWHQGWRGQVCVIRTLEQALAAIGATK